MFKNLSCSKSSKFRARKSVEYHYYTYSDRDSIEYDTLVQQIFNTLGHLYTKEAHFKFYYRSFFPYKKQIK